MKIYSYLIILVLIASGCRKERVNQEPQNPPNATSLSQLTIGKNFNWSAGFKENVTLNINAPSYLKVEGEMIEFYQGDGSLLSRLPIHNNVVSYKMVLPYTEHALYAYFPNTGHYVDISRGGIIDFDIPSSDLDGILPETPVPPFLPNVFAKKSASSNNLLINGDFETGPVNQVDSRSTVNMRTTGDWFKRSGNVDIVPANGSNVFTTSAPGHAQIIQSFAVIPGRQYTFEADATGQTGLRIFLFDDEKNLVGYIAPAKNNDRYNFNYTLPRSVHYAQVFCHVEPTAMFDNLSATLVAEPDSDGDGVIDRLDDYPNDAGKAIANYYPLLGRQFLAFEDLWPAQGDYDFNDLVLSNQVEYSYNKHGKMVEATVRIQINAMGAGIPSGVGVKLYDAKGKPLSGNIVASFTGEGREDAGVENGFILFDNVRDGFDHYFTNTSHNSTGEPKEFEFSITFEPNASPLYLVPDIYMFRTSDRGREIHLPGTPATEEANTSYFGTQEDDNGTYRTKNGLPWALELLTPANYYFKHPLEKVDIVSAYPYFQTWAESSGSRYIGWMTLPNSELVYDVGN